MSAFYVISHRPWDKGQVVYLGGDPSSTGDDMASEKEKERQTVRYTLPCQFTEFVTAKTKPGVNVAHMSLSHPTRRIISWALIPRNINSLALQPSSDLGRAGSRCQAEPSYSWDSGHLSTTVVNAWGNPARKAQIYYSTLTFTLLKVGMSFLITFSCFKIQGTLSYQFPLCWLFQF
jgi:hypothetical protein